MNPVTVNVQSQLFYFQLHLPKRFFEKYTLSAWTFFPSGFHDSVYYNDKYCTFAWGILLVVAFARKPCPLKRLFASKRPSSQDKLAHMSFKLNRLSALQLVHKICILTWNLLLTSPVSSLASNLQRSYRPSFMTPYLPGYPRPIIKLVNILILH